MTPAKLYALFRADVVDEVKKYLWTDVEVWSFMTEAESMFCRLTGGLQDSSSSLTELAVSAGENSVVLSDKILAIHGASLRSTERDVKVLNYEDLSRGDNGRLYTRQYMNQTGPVRAIVLGMDERAARLVQVPAADDTIDLVLERLPLNELSATAEFEVAEQHQRPLILWMEYLAYAKQDYETFDKAKSEARGLSFRAYCKDVTSEKARRKHKPRLVRYGGI